MSPRYEGKPIAAMSTVGESVLYPDLAHVRALLDIRLVTCGFAD
jgi:hypothetical protein